MLDLKELEKKVDEMIAKDTPEEMMTWLLNKKMEDFAGFISAGAIESLNSGLESKFINPIMVRKPQNKGS